MLRACTVNIGLAAVTLLLLAGCADQRVATDPPLASEAGWVRDREGGVVLLRGFNYSGLEFGNFVERANGPEEADFAQIAAWGANVVRVPIAWSYLEPEPNVFDETYLAEQVDFVVEAAGRHGLAVVIDMHQYLWSPCTGGNGVPAWTCEGMGYPRTAEGAYDAQSDFWAGALAPDGRPLVDHLLDTWDLVARRYAGSEVVVGFDLLNEPGDWRHQSTFEHDALYPFYRGLAVRIRAAGAGQMLFVEPPISRNIGVRAKPEPIGDPSVVFAPHLYTTTFGLPGLKYTGDREAVAEDLEQADAEAGDQGGPLFVGEYGGITDVEGGFLAATEQFFADALAEQDRVFAGSVWWAYFPSDNGFSIVDVNGTPKGGLVDVFVRPWARRIAGVPLEMRVDDAGGTFVLRFAEDASRRVRRPTEIFLPPDWIARGVEIETSDGAGFAIDELRSVVLVERDPSRAEHEILVRVAG